MNKFVKLPLFLGGVCLIFCTSLAVVVNICQPRIAETNAKKEKEAYQSLYAGVNLDDIINITDEISFDGFKQIDKLVVIPHESDLSCVYSLTSEDPQSGSVSFMLGIDLNNNVVDSYAVIANNNSGYASAYENIDNIKEALVEYGKTGKKDDFYYTGGATKTDRVMRNAVNQAFKHYNDNRGKILTAYDELKGGQNNG